MKPHFEERWKMEHLKQCLFDFILHLFEENIFENQELKESAYL